MNILKTNIEGLLVIEPGVHEDGRGYFYESFNLNKFNNATGLDFNPVQDNESMSCFGVIRGLHYQKPPFAQAKLVRVVQGEVIDVAVDMRPESVTFGQYVAVTLNDVNKRQFFIPKGFAHGFAVLSEEAIFQYKCDEYYHPEAEGGVSYKIINWQAITNNKIKPEDFIISPKDEAREKVNSPEELLELAKEVYGDKD